MPKIPSKTVDLSQLEKVGQYSIQIIESGNLVALEVANVRGFWRYRVGKLPGWKPLEMIKTPFRVLLYRENL